MGSSRNLMNLNVLAMIVLSALTTVVRAADNGMDMSMDGAMSLTMGQMRAYLHFTSGDTLWFLGWVPESRGAMAGACIGLFLLALVDRWLAAIRATAELSWSRRAHLIMANRLNQSKSTKNDDGLRPGFKTVLTLGNTPPFIPAHDIVRGILHAGQAALSFAFMLAVMTYNAAFIICIVAGLGIGEMLFGRYIGASKIH
ncbi:CTR copper uptake transporter [Pholiota conissans]|uniref:Copper transport protein n=1 Tax=Pholiota conissans TaxID=109636 RepID=A0A9P5YWS7_9AGAR|nr:CTR copper uptake transporter [Pholiota conissans]